jgi:hypothetical protein
VAAGFFPLDKELQVPDGHLLPHAQETLVRLSSELPFERVAQHLERTLGVVVHASTARRQTLAAGQRMLEVQNKQAQPLCVCPEEPAAERMVMSSDGTMVPLVGGVWAEVKVVAIGAVERRRRKDEEQIVTTQLTYFARMAKAATFADQASAEVRRRGVERAKEVCAIQDGAEWIQGFVQGHRHDALRILDFAHAADYIIELAEKVREGGGHLPAKWVDGILHRLKHEGPARVLRHLSRLARHAPHIQEQVNYLQKRGDLMDYPTYQQQGWPIGSGSVESSHKFVVQARLKGAGMHWKPEHVNPMLALRLALLNDRWSESWQEQHRLRLHQRHLKRQARQQQRLLAHQAKRQQTQPPSLPVASTPKPTRQKTGRTEAQYRWGRQTFSPRMLKQADGAKKCTAPLRMGWMNDSAGKFCPDIMMPSVIATAQKATKNAWAEAAGPELPVAASDGCAPS